MFNFFKFIMWVISISGMSYIAQEHFGWHGTLFVIFAVWYDMSARNMRF